MKLVVLVALLVAAVYTQHTCGGKPNMNDIITGDMVLVDKAKNALKMHVPQDTNNITIVHLYGSAKDVGIAQGTIVKQEMKTLIDELFDFYINEADGYVEKYVSFLPTSVRHFLIHHLLLTLLDIQWMLVEEYVPQRFIDELEGIAEGSGIDYAMLRRVNVIPELIQMQCSMMGAWGPATADSKTEDGYDLEGSLIQLRALDFETKGPFQKYLQLTVYHPDQGNTFASFTFPGFIGAITGISAAGLAISQKVWIHIDTNNATRSRIGYPTGFLLRDVLQFSDTKEEAIDRAFSIRRTNSIFFGVGDKHSMAFDEMKYAHNELIVYSDKNFTAWDTHPAMDGVLFVTKGTQPQDSTCMAGQIEKYYGKITPEVVMRYITAMEATGDLHVAIYDFKNFNMYLAGATPVQEDGSYVPAYERPYLKVNLDVLFTMEPPHE